MAKEERPIISDRSIEKVIDLVKKLQETSLKHDEMKQELKQEKLENERERLVKEFNRLCDTLEKTDVTDKDYHTIVNNMNNLKYILDFWY